MTARVPQAVWLIPCAALLIALADMPYGYYLFLRILVCAAAAWIAWAQYAQGTRADSWVVTFGVLAILYNPVVSMRLDRGTWEIANMLTIAVFALHWLRYRRARG